MDTLLNLSGGIDSAYCLYQYALSKTPLLIHFCELINHEGRASYEKKAVKNLLKWVNYNLPFEYKYIETSFDYRNAGKPIVKDKYIIGFTTALVLNNRLAESVDKVIISSNKEDVSRLEYMEKTEAIRKLLITSLGKSVEYIYPIREKTKAELIQELPADYLKYTWFCRTPKEGKPCGQCHTCRQVLPHLNRKLN